MATSLRVSQELADSLRRRAVFEKRTMSDLVERVLDEYFTNNPPRALLDQVLETELPRYAEALECLGE